MHRRSENQLIWLLCARPFASIQPKWNNAKQFTTITRPRRSKIEIQRYSEPKRSKINRFSYKKENVSIDFQSMFNNCIRFAYTSVRGVFAIAIDRN